jgi:hypothetical protein
MALSDLYFLVFNLHSFVLRCEPGPVIHVKWTQYGKNVGLSLLTKKKKKKTCFCLGHSFSHLLSLSLWEDRCQVLSCQWRGMKSRINFFRQQQQRLEVCQQPHEWAEKQILHWLVLKVTSPSYFLRKSEAPNQITPRFLIHRCCEIISTYFNLLTLSILS